MKETQSELQHSYDRVAGEYAGQFCDELEKKPFDRLMLRWLAEKVKGLGQICTWVAAPDRSPAIYIAWE